MTPRRIAALVVVAALVMVASASTADTLTLTLVSQNSTTITLGWTPQAGYGYLFSADGNLVSRTNDASRSSVKFSKSFSTYEVAVVVKGATGTYPTAPPPAQCADGVDNDGDGKVDLADPGCTGPTDNDETNVAPPPPAQCSDGLDNDSDGKIDYPADPGCASATDTDETDGPPPPPTGFPDASNTGVPAGTTLTAYTGSSRITTANTVISGKTMGNIEIAASGVVIRNSRINGTVYLDDRDVYGKVGALIEDSEIVCQQAGDTGVSEANVTLRRVDISRCENGLSINQNVTVEDSYIHDLNEGGGSHTDGIQLSFGHWNGSSYPCCALNVTIRHNTIFGMGFNGQFGTSAIISNKNAPGDQNILIDNNLLAGGAYTLYCDQNGIKGTNYRVTNNHFSTRFRSTVGFFGSSTDCSDETQSGNVIHETGQPLTLG